MNALKVYKDGKVEVIHFGTNDTLPLHKRMPTKREAIRFASAGDVQAP